MAELLLTFELVLTEFSRWILGNRGVVMAAVKNNGMALQYASSEMQGTEDVVVAA